MISDKFKVDVIIALDKYYNLQDLFNVAVKYRMFRGYNTYSRVVVIIRKCPYHIRLKFWGWLWKYNVKKVGKAAMPSLTDYLDYAK